MLEKLAKDILTLLRCSLTNDIPDCSDMDIDRILSISKNQSISAIISYSILKGTKNEKASLLFNKAVKRMMMFDFEREEILKELSLKRIWHMPLKGVILKELYPVYGLREMSDNDILFDKKYQKEVRTIFLKRGYKPESYHQSNHDVYMKDPIYNFEMHTNLFGERMDRFMEYYKNVKNDRLIKSKDDAYLYSFNDNDFYIYFMCHLLKHKKHSGIGLRFYLDTYIYNMKHSDLDQEYLTSEFTKLGIEEDRKEMEEISRILLSKDSNMDSFSDGIIDLIHKTTRTSTYGDMDTMIRNEIKEKGWNKNERSKYLFHRLFPSRKQIKEAHPFYYRTIIFMPVFYILRIFKGIFKRRKAIKNEIECLNHVIKRK